MNQDIGFSYNYSAKENREVQEIRKKYLLQEKKEKYIMNQKEKEFIVQKIRTQYTEKENTQLDALKELDKKVKRPANVFAGVFGSVSAIIMGSGMSFVMTDIGSIIGITSPMVPGIIIGILGLIMALLTYPLYKKILESRKKKYADEIIKLSDSIMSSK